MKQQLMFGQEEPKTPHKPKIKKAKKEIDPRHVPFKALIFKCYEYLNGEEPPWDGSDAKQLSALLAAMPKLSEDKFHKMLGNYAKSQNINPPDRPRLFIQRITSYSAGPLNDFGKPAVKISPKLVSVESPREKLNRQLGLK
jgi:hypothetical protein